MGDFEVARRETIAADPRQVHELIDDFRRWRAWSPWEGLDPNMQRSYSGPEAGAGSRYEWEGNRKAGKGSMEILESNPSLVGLELKFVKPFKATNRVDFELAPAGEGTQVTWRMTGQQRGLASLFAKVFPMEKMVGRDMEKGLDRMKAAAEA